MLSFAFSLNRKGVGCVAHPAAGIETQAAVTSAIPLADLDAVCSLGMRTIHLADERNRRLWPRAMFTVLCAWPMMEVDP
jgi:hypothetical protein